MESRNENLYYAIGIVALSVYLSAFMLERDNYSHTKLVQPCLYSVGSSECNLENLNFLDTNATQHLYPYLASFLSVTILLTLIMVIICLGPSLE